MFFLMSEQAAKGFKAQGCEELRFCLHLEPFSAVFFRLFQCFVHMFGSLSEVP
jgi:hypothetical protein